MQLAVVFIGGFVFWLRSVLVLRKLYGVDVFAFYVAVHVVWAVHISLVRVLGLRKRLFLLALNLYVLSSRI
jgi:hypothetical protein